MTGFFLLTNVPTCFVFLISTLLGKSLLNGYTLGLYKILVLVDCVFPYLGNSLQHLHRYYPIVCWGKWYYCLRKFKTQLSWKNYALLCNIY